MDNFKSYLLYQKEIAEAKLNITNRFLKEAKPEPIKRASKLDVVENILKLAGRPLHVSEIIEIAQRDFQTEIERDSIVSILIKKIKAGQKFTRTAPNTFALKE